MQARSNFPILQGIQHAAVDICLFSFESLHCALEVVGEKLIVVIERLVVFRVALLESLPVEPAAVLDIRLHTGADQRQVKALGKSFAQGPWSVDEKDDFKFAISLRGNAINGIVEISGVNSIVNPHAKGHLCVLMLQRGVGQDSKSLSVGAHVIGPERKFVHRSETLHGIELGRFQNSAVRDLGEALGVFMPIDENTVLSFLDESRDAAVFGDNNWNSTAQRLRGGEQKAFPLAVTEQDMAALETMAIVEGVEIEWPHIKTIRHAEFPRQLVNFFHRFALHPERVIQTCSLRTGPGPHHDVRIFRQEIWQGHETLVLERTPHPADHKTALGIQIPFRHAELGYRRRENSAGGVAILLNPIAVAIHDLLGNARHCHATTTFVGLAEITPASIVPGMQHERGRPLRQAVEVSVTQEPHARISRGLARDVSTIKSTFHRLIKQWRVIRLTVERGPVAHPLWKSLNIAQHRGLRTTKGHVVTDKTRSDLRK